MQHTTAISATYSDVDKQSEQNISDSTTRANQSPLAFDDGTTTSGKPLSQEIFEKYREKVFKARPNFRTINETSGDLPLFDYLRRQIRENRNKVIKERKAELIEVISDETRRLLGSAIGDSVARQLKDNNAISTIQHSAPLSHPYVLSSTLQNALPLFGDNKPFMKNAIVLSCANISFNNYKFPRGHLFHTYKKGEVKTHSLPLFGHTADARPVIFHPPYHHSAITDIKNRILSIKRDGDLTDEEAEKLIAFFENIYATSHPLSPDNYHDQLTITNYRIFKTLFADYQKSAPNLVFISQESVALQLILKYHLHQDTIVNYLLFNSKGQKLVNKYFDGLNGAFSSEDNYGTFLFWGLPADGKYRIQLWKKGSFLQSEDGAFKVELTPAAIADAIQRREIFPNTLLTFILLSFYYGMYLGGGPAQTHNLTRMKDAYLALTEEIGDTKSKEAAVDVMTSNLIISRPTLAFIDIPKNDQRIPATGLDLILYSDKGKAFDKTIEATKKTTLSEFFNRALESFYAEFVPAKDKEPRLTMITERDIEKFTGLDKKIPPLITF